MMDANGNLFKGLLLEVVMDEDDLINGMPVNSKIELKNLVETDVESEMRYLGKVIKNMTILKTKEGSFDLFLNLIVRRDYFSKRFDKIVDYIQKIQDNQYTDIIELEDTRLSIGTVLSLMNSQMNREDLMVDVRLKEGDKKNCVYRVPFSRFICLAKNCAKFTVVKTSTFDLL